MSNTSQDSRCNPLRVAVVGSPLVGKLSVLQALSRASSSSIARAKEEVQSGFFKGMPTVIRSCGVWLDKLPVEFSCVSGNVPAEANLRLFPAEFGVFVFDSQPGWYTSQRELWASLRSMLAAKQWLFIVSKKDRQLIDDIPSFLETQGAPPHQASLHLSLLDPAAPDILLSFFKANVALQDK